MNIEMLEQMAEQTIENGLKDGGFRSRILVFTTDGLFLHFDYASGTDDERSKMQDVILRSILAARIIGTFDGAAMIGDIWLSKAPLPNLPASRQPDKIEGVMYQIYDGAQTVTRCWRCERKGEVLLRVEPWTTTAKFSGWFDSAAVQLPLVISDSIKAQARDWLEAKFKKHDPAGKV